MAPQAVFDIGQKQQYPGFFLAGYAFAGTEVLDQSKQRRYR